MLWGVGIIAGSAAFGWIIIFIEQYKIPRGSLYTAMVYCFFLVCSVLLILVADIQYFFISGGITLGLFIYSFCVSPIVAVFRK
jgi:hypothetical protein